MDKITMKTYPRRRFSQKAPILIRRKRLASNGEILETQDFPDTVAIGNDIFQCVLSGDEETVKNYLKLGKNPNLEIKTEIPLYTWQLKQEILTSWKCFYVMIGARLTVLTTWVKHL